MTANHNNRRSQKSDRKKKKREYSKVIVAWCFAIITFFILFACYEVHRLSDTSSIEYITDIVKYLAVVAVGGYFFKSRAENKVKLQIEYQRQASELRKKYGDDFIAETLDFDSLFD